MIAVCHLSASLLILNNNPRDKYFYHTLPLMIYSYIVISKKHQSSQYLYIFTGSFLRRWKKSWFVLFTNGHLMYYDSPDSREALDQVLLHSSCIAVNTGKVIAKLVSHTHTHTHAHMHMLWYACKQCK